MATLSHSESRRLYSWWWDSHISPKNSKWLQENLSDMDSKVKAMIRLIEEDAESFAQRAEMFYKKRPELMKLVEEFYRAYRALAERYDHATGALRQAHQKMAEAFPNEIPLEFSDEPASGYSLVDVEHDILEMDIALFLPDDLQHVLPTSKITLKQLRDTFTGGELTKELKFHEEERYSNCKLLLKENQDLKNRIIYESARADEAESEVHCLREDSSKARVEKEDAVSRCKEAEARTSYLEYEISCMQADIEKIDHGDQINQTMKANQVLISELEELKQRIREQQKQLDRKEEELQKLSISLKDEQKQKIEVEIACLSNEKKLSECQEKIKDAQLSKRSLEEAMLNIRRENGKLNEEKLSSALKIINLQDEIISLRGLKGKLQSELNIQEEEKAAIQQELNCLKEDRNDLEKRYHDLMEEIRLVNSNVQFLQVMISDLRDGNFELKEAIKKQVDKKYHLLNTQQVGKLSEKNATLENTISDANNELQILRDKIRTLEDSCYYLHGRVSINQVEKAHLMSHVEAISNNMEKISREKIFLENTLCDMNSELDALRGKFKGLEESSQSLHVEKSTLLLEKMSVVSQVESISQSLKNLERRYAALEGKHSNLQKEKNSTLYQVEELQGLLNLEREEHNAFVQSSNSQLSGLVNQIQQLQMVGRQKEEELELEQIKIMNAQIEIFVLQRCLCDMKERNLILSIGSKKHQESLRCSEKLFLELEEECVAQEKKMRSIKEHNEKLRAWIYLIVQLLKIDIEHISLDDIKDEVLMQLIFREIRRLLCTISEVQEEKQHLHHEKSVVVALLKQVGAYVEDLRTDKAAFMRESKAKNEEFSLLKNKSDKFFMMNEQLREKLQASNQREEALKAELDTLYQQISALQDAYCSLQTKITSIHEEKDKLEKENNFLISDFMALGFFSLTLQSLIAEKGFELRLLSKERNQLQKAQKCLDGEIRVINGKIILLQAESSCIDELITELENCRSPEGEGNMRSSMQLARNDTNRNNNSLELEGNMRKLEKKEYSSSKGPSIMKGEADGLLKHAEELRRREKYFDSTMMNRMDELSSCNVEIKLLKDDVSLTTGNVVSLEAKINELIKSCQAFEHSLMIHVHTLQGEVKQRNFIINQQKEELNILDKENKGLKADLDAYLLLMRSLWDDISLLEEQVVSLAKRHTSTKHQKKKDIQMKFSMKKKQEPSENYGAMRIPGSVKLQDLHSKIKILKKVVMDTGSLLQLERLNSTTSTDTASSETEVISKDIQQEESAKMNCRQIRRDTQLDIVLNSSDNRNLDLSGRLQKTRSIEVFVDQVSELCRTTEESCRSQNQKPPFVVPEDDIVAQCYDGVDGCGSSFLELVAEKELAVDKLVLPTKPESHQEWSRRVMQRLSSDNHRLLVLQACVRKLQNNIEESEKVNHPTSELEHVKEQLKETERSISKLIDTNHKLTSRVEDFPAPTDRLVNENNDEGSGSRRQITDGARKMSEKIARLEIEMQKIQYSMLKTDEEGNMKRTKVVDRRSGVPLKDYIYGRRNSRRQKKGSCGCIRPKANGD